MEDLKEKDSTGSYVEPRIPSITGFGQRRVNGKPKKVLDYSFELNSGIPKIDVCLRLKPRLDDGSRRCDDTLAVLNDTTVSCYNGNTREDVTEYTFSSVFGPNVDQKEFFNTWVYDKVLRFLNGNSELLFAYGTTNAGKTYTMHGNLNDPGLIPRTLVFVFNTLNNKLMTQCKYKPDKVMAAHVLDEQLMGHEEEIRNKILNTLSYEKNQDDDKYSSQLDEGQIINGIDHLNSNNIGKIFDLLKNNEKASLDHGDVSYTVWATYSEIYNESIYDLFDINCSTSQKRIPLKLTLDQNKNVYVKGLTHVFIKSAEEAYKAMSFGRNNLKIASNTLNKSSSRSHCIFTLKLMRVENVESPSTAVISSITFCDLAGSERLKKTMNIGDRLAESKKINTSLLVLNKCFSVLRDNQKRGENHLVPFRESKLTQMFQTALTGINRTGISMSVNVDMSPSLFEETKQVLFMSAIVRSIAKSKPKNNSKPRPSFVVWAANNGKNSTQAKFKQNTIFENTDCDCSNSEKKIDNKDLETKVLEEKKKLKQELLSQFNKMLTDNNTFYNKQKETALKNKTEMYESKIERLKSYYLEKIQEKDEKLTSLLNSKQHNYTTNYVNNKSEIENYEFRIGEFQLQKEELVAEIDTLKTAHQEEIDIKNLEIKNLKNVQAEQQQDLDDKNQEIENYKIMLTEANLEYENMDDNLNKMYNKFDEACQLLEERDMEIERLTGSLEAKENLITEMENQQELQIAECAEKKILEYMEEKLQEIVSLEDNLKKEKMKHKKCLQDKSEIAKEYQNLKQQYRIRAKYVNQLTSSNTVLSSELADIKLKMTELKEQAAALESTLADNERRYNKELQAALKEKCEKPESKSIAVLTDISNVQLPLTIITDSDGKENKNTEKKSTRKCRIKTPMSITKKGKNNKYGGTPEMCEKMLDEVINNIPISTRKRRLFDNKPPLADNSNIPSDDLLDSILTPTSALHQTTKFRIKK
ncbi:Hypothetical protein CINCED_3A025906 [Cinara cedri]|uniref:Kinesin-like protein n=2 Tax=Cinara cedri TaxID=506608 RepID=A0A5E4NRH1_9HEMI|nr:Hypothetical protein CINCED_3A025906 [Cinara cedri]